MATKWILPEHMMLYHHEHSSLVIPALLLLFKQTIKTAELEGRPPFFSHVHDWSHTGFVALTHNVNLVWTESIRVWPEWIHVYDNQYQPRLQVWTCLKIVSNKHHIECTRSNNTSQKCFKVPLSTTDLQALVYFYNFIYLYVGAAYLKTRESQLTLSKHCTNF